MPTNATIFHRDSPIELTLDIKNVSKLIVKAYRINALNYYQDQNQPVPSDINLDGLVANYEFTYNYDESPFRRVRRRYEFGDLERAGTYIIDFIGGGRSCRALIHRGSLQSVERMTAAGQAITVLNERDEVVPDAKIWMAGRIYTANDRQEIVIPFATRATTTSIVLMDGDVVSRQPFVHQGEDYKFAAGIHLDRESARTRHVVPVVARTALSVNGTPIGLGALENITLTVVSTDIDGTESRQQVNDLELGRQPRPCPRSPYSSTYRATHGNDSGGSYAFE